MTETSKETPRQYLSAYR